MSNAQQITKPSHTIRVVAICGSLRRDSYTRKALQLALAGAAELGAETQLIDLREYDLVFCDGDTESEDLPEGVERLRRDVQRSQGILLGTPEYHGGYSGVLKNALDLMGFAEFEGKMIGLVGVSGGRMGATNSLSSLRAVGRALHAWVLPDEVSIPQSRNAFNPDGTLKDPQTAQRVKELGRQVARFAFLHTAQQTLEFLHAWEEAPYNPGGE